MIFEVWFPGSLAKVISVGIRIEAANELNAVERARLHLGIEPTRRFETVQLIEEKDISIEWAFDGKNRKK